MSLSLVRFRLLAALTAGFCLPLAGTTHAAPPVRSLEFGPYVGAYDFDPSTWFEDRALFGLRATVRLAPRFGIDAEFDEVYTRRERSGNSARQVSLAVHGRFEPLSASRLSPGILAGLAFVGLDDSEDPDAFSEAYDLGAGVRCRLNPRWTLRADWMLRAQRFQVLQIPRDEAGSESSASTDVSATADPSTLWGRSLRIGASYAF